MDRRFLVGPVCNCNPNQHVVGRGLGIFRKDVEISLIFEDTGIFKLILWFKPGSTAIFFDQLCIRKFGLRIFIESFHVRMRRRRIKVEVRLFDVFTVIPFRPGQTKQSFFENRISTVPERQRKTQAALPVTDS